MSAENCKKYIDINGNTRNFIAENVTNIQKLQDHVKTIIRQKSEMELKRSFRRRINHKMDCVRSKSFTGYGYGNRIKKSKKDKRNERAMIRPQSPELGENEEPQTFIETFKEISLEDKTRIRSNVVNSEVNVPKTKNVNVRDFGCQYGDPKRTYFFEDGSNINVYIPSKAKSSSVLEKEADVNKNLPYVVPSRYLLFKKKTYDEEIAKQINNIKNLKKARGYRQREYREQKQREFRRTEVREQRQQVYNQVDQRQEYVNQRYKNEKSGEYRR